MGSVAVGGVERGGCVRTRGTGSSLQHVKGQLSP